MKTVALSFKSSLSLLVMFSMFGAMAQNNNRQCLAEIMKCEAASMHLQDSTLMQKNIYMYYTVRVTNWDDETTVSNVKLYRQGYNMHFFSEQANIYMDEKEILLVMPYQKLIAINSNNKELASKRLSQDFFMMRKEFMDSCDVVKCENREANHKVVMLKVNKTKVAEGVFIETLTYEYDYEAGKILSVAVTYNDEYKLKQMSVYYHDFNTNGTYDFPSLRSKILDRKGNLREKYKGYEVMDSRDKKSKANAR